jgi:hypothetical protein
MNKAMLVSNPCTRCGKQRVDGRITRESFGDGFVIVTQTICPDSECQKAVDGQLEKERERREELKDKSKFQQKGSTSWMRKKAAI